MEFIHQPSDGNRLFDYLNEGFTGSWTHFRAAIAFVKRSGTRHIEGSLASFAQKREVEFIAGIDHRGSSYEGLQSLLHTVSPNGKVIVFHNLMFCTFHPKIYLFKSSVAADLVVGSGNLTGGGLSANYEANIRLRLNLTNPNEAKFLKSVEEVLDRWSDLSVGTARLLDEQLLAQLADWDLISSELSVASPSIMHESVGGLTKGHKDFPFVARSEPGVLPFSPHRRDVRVGGPSQQTYAVSGPKIGFVMILQKTDVGVGQTAPNTSRRSPEIFIPLTARNADVEFWKWPKSFVEDPKKPGKFDRHGVRMRLGSKVIDVNMMTWPDKHDFRLRSESLRSAGEIGDILRLERTVDFHADYEYHVEVIRQGTTQYPVYKALCSNPVPNSQKWYGYY